MVDPANVLAIDDIAVMTGYEVRPAVASLADVEWLLERLEDPNFGDGAIAPEELEDRRRSPTAAPAPAAPAAPLYDMRENAADQLRRRRRGRVGHPARAPGDRGGRRARRLRHPLRAPGRGDAGPLPHRRRAPGGRDRARVSAIPAVVSPHQDPLRPRHRRAPHPAGRPHLDRGRRTSRSTCASPRCPRSYGEKVVMRILDQTQGHDPARAAGHAPAGARAVHEGVRPGPRRRARHRPDRLRQVDLALRRAQPAQHDREAHHHDRGPGRVPAPRASRRSRSTTRRA